MFPYSTETTPQKSLQRASWPRWLSLLRNKDNLKAKFRKKRKSAHESPASDNKLNKDERQKEARLKTLQESNAERASAKKEPGLKSNKRFPTDEESAPTTPPIGDSDENQEKVGEDKGE